MHGVGRVGYRNAGLQRSRFGKIADKGNFDFSNGTTAGTRVASTRRRTPPLREGMAIEQLKCQSLSATVTNPGVIPVDTNANVQRYHRNVDPSNTN